jgi:hypothetical protein
LGFSSQNAVRQPYHRRHPDALKSRRPGSGDGLSIPKILTSIISSAGYAAQHLPIFAAYKSYH